VSGLARSWSRARSRSTGFLAARRRWRALCRSREARDRLVADLRRLDAVHAARQAWGAGPCP
jgi:hypothetical protein